MEIYWHIAPFRVFFHSLGVDAPVLIKAALMAYGLPLATALLGGGLAQWLAGGDLESMAAAVAGLAVGWYGAGCGARRLSARGELAPRFLRRARLGESCGGKIER